MGTQLTFATLGTPLREVEFCVVDLETTGTAPRLDTVTEIGAVRLCGGAETGRFHTLVNPGIPIPPAITYLTGITEAMVSAAPTLDSVLPAFCEFVRRPLLASAEPAAPGTVVIVGHNVRFDLSFLNVNLVARGYEPLPRRAVDTLSLARRLLQDEVRNCRLETLARHFRTPTRPCHRALDDALATGAVLHGLLERAGTIGVLTLEDLLELPRARGRPAYGKLSLTAGVPRAPGVYLFRDQRGTVLYAGKAKDLRQRVRSYFYGDTRRHVHALLRELHHVEHRVCEHELEAEIAELRLIQGHLPRYNRRSRNWRDRRFVRLTAERYPRLAITAQTGAPALGYLGPFRSRRHAELVVEALWDATPVRRCTGRTARRDGGCTWAQLGRSLCPCTGVLPPAEYAEAIAPLVAAFAAGQPGPLLERLEMRMLDAAAAERFEDAARHRDRLAGLEQALHRQRLFLALHMAGTLDAQTAAGDGARVEQGRLVATWRAGRPPPARLPPAGGHVFRHPGQDTAEEMLLVARFLGRPDVQVLSCSGMLADGLRPFQ